MTTTLPARPAPAPAPSGSPVRVDADLDQPLSRWLWLVKWLLAIPHYFLLALLWAAFAVLTVVAFFAVLFTGRYPRAVFDFNVGVLRWTWRVTYYAYGALGTDRYPPFTLAEVPDYPAHLEIAYPERLSRGLVLVKWWLLAIPHYMVVGFFIGAGGWAAWQYDDVEQPVWTTGLVGLLVLVAAVVLAFTGRYPTSVFDLLLGLNRWVLRVAAYAGLMTDAYPPFRLDMGGHEPAALAVGTAAAASEPAAVSGPPEATGRPAVTAPPEAAAHEPPTSGWTTGRIVSVVAGSLLAWFALGGLAAGGAMLVADTALRDDGYATTPTRTFSTSGRALVSEPIFIEEGVDVLDDVVGTMRIQVRAIGTSEPVFMGIGPADDVDAYLDGVATGTVRDIGIGIGTTETQGTAIPEPPADQDFWVTSETGTGQQELLWQPRTGVWRFVVMQENGSPELAVRADVGATVPWLGAAAVGLLVVSFLVLVVAATLVVLPVQQAGRRRREE